MGAVRSNSLLQLEMYQDQSFMKQVHAQPAFLNVESTTIMAFLNYFQERVSHITKEHGKMGRITALSPSKLQPGRSFILFWRGAAISHAPKKKQLIRLFSSSFTAAHSKFCKYFKEGAQPASKFLYQIQVLDPTNLSDVQHDFTSIDSIPGFQAVSKQEWSLNVNHLGPLSKPAKMETLT